MAVITFDGDFRLDFKITEAVTRMNRDELALQAAQSSFAKISQLNLFDYIK